MWLDFPVTHPGLDPGPTSRTMKKVLPLLLAALLLFSAIGHIFSPEFYAPMIPPFISATLANVLAAIVEAVLGIMLIWPKFRKWGGLGFALLMVAFLPIHVWDLVRDEPAVGSTMAAAIRLIVQFVLIYAGWWIWKKYEA